MENLFGITVVIAIIVTIIGVLINEWHLNRDMFKDWKTKK